MSIVPKIHLLKVTPVNDEIRFMNTIVPSEENAPFTTDKILVFLSSHKVNKHEHI